MSLLKLVFHYCSNATTYIFILYRLYHSYSMPSLAFFIIHHVNSDTERCLTWIFWKLFRQFHCNVFIGLHEGQSSHCPFQLSSAGWIFIAKQNWCTIYNLFSWMFLRYSMLCFLNPHLPSLIYTLFLILDMNRMLVERLNTQITRFF